MTSISAIDARPLALTMGEPAGIGPDITLKAWMGRTSFEVPPFVFVGSSAALRVRANILGLDVTVQEVDRPDQAIGIFDRALPVLPLQCQTVTAGKPTISTASTVIEAIEVAVKLTQAGQVSGVVTNPIAKAVLKRAGFPHPGHTEFLGQLAKPDSSQAPPRAVMMLAAEELKVVPVTIHIPLADVSVALTSDLIVETAEIVAHDLKNRFGLAAPRLALSGLNPHAGEDGTMGREDQDIITPAIARLVAQGHHVVGPLPADTMFHAQARRTYDVAICMYHDQALIPIKTLAFDRGVNVTLGLDFIRTSPDHGTAFEIAGSGVAQETSLVEALKLAHEMAKSQTETPYSDMPKSSSHVI